MQDCLMNGRFLIEMPTSDFIGQVGPLVELRNQAQGDREVSDFQAISHRNFRHDWRQSAECIDRKSSHKDTEANSAL